MKITKPETVGFHPKLTDEEYLEIMRKMRNLEYDDDEEDKMVEILNYWYPIFTLGALDLPDEEILKMAKEKAKNDVICL